MCYYSSSATPLRRAEATDLDAAAVASSRGRATFIKAPLSLGFVRGVYTPTGGLREKGKGMCEEDLRG